MKENQLFLDKVFRKFRKTIETYGLLSDGDRILVGLSGGKDSLALLEMLGRKKQSPYPHFSMVALHVSMENIPYKADVDYLKQFAEKCGAEFVHVTTSFDPSTDKRKSPCFLCSWNRRKMLFSVAKEMNCNKIALGHHMVDQAETILLNIFRGSGIAGASGMDYVRDGVYIRPLLRTDRTEIMAYVNLNEIPYVDDETNENSDFSRNYIRNMVMPLLRNRWGNVYQSICNFGELCKLDDDYIYSTINDNSVVYEGDGVVKVPVNFFSYPVAVTNRVLRKAFKGIGVNSDIERKHLKIINNLAIEAENGSKITLPNKVSVIKEYNYITITNRNFKPEPKTWELTKGKIDIPNFGVLDCQVTRKFDIGEYSHLVDYNKIPKNAIWRYRKDGDIFTKFGGGTKSLSDYLIDEKIPARLRTYLPVLASGNEILIIAGVEISDKVKVTDETKTAWAINAVRFN